MGSNLMKREKFKVIKEGYEEGAQKYRDSKDERIIQSEIFEKWFSLIREGPVLDLGCGSGYPVAERFIRGNKKYLGVDLAEVQIELAKTQYPSLRNNFKVAEMLETCQNAGSACYGGIICLHSLFHLPREVHVVLLSELRRILQVSAPLLISVPEKGGEGSEKNWLGTKDMWWSSFSYDWYYQKLIDLGFVPIKIYRDKSIFLDKEEINWFLLFQK
jgi:SAM-dependent methyltransferase